MNNLPTAVRKQLESIDAMYVDPSAAPGDEQPQSEEPSEGAPAPAAEVAEQHGDGQPATAPAQEPTDAPAAPAPTPAATTKDDAAVWEQRYKTLQGMVNQTSADQKARLKEAQAQIAELNKQLAQAKAEKTQPIDPKLIETFGEEMLTMVREVVKAEAAQTINSLQSRLDGVETRLDGTADVVTGTAEGLFLERLRQLDPGYESQNTDAGFIAWLQEPDPVYGVPRQQALDSAVQNLDAQRVASVFRAYRDQTAPAPAAAPAAPASARARLEKQVSPRTNAGSPPTTLPAAKKVYSQSEVAAFYDDIAKGRYRGRDDDMAREEAAINQAIAEGRVR